MLSLAFGQAGRDPGPELHNASRCRSRDLPASRPRDACASLGSSTDTSDFLVDTSCAAVPAAASKFAVASGGADCFAVWLDKRNGELLGTRLPAGSPPIDYPCIQLPGGDVWEPAVAFNGSCYLVAWNDYSGGIWGARVSIEGSLLDTPKVLFGPGDCYYSVSITSDGANWFVAWIQYGHLGFPELCGARVRSDGVVLDPGGIQIRSDLSRPTLPYPGQVQRHQAQVAFGSGEYLVVWQEWLSGTIYGNRVTTSGSVPDSSDILIPSPTGAQYPPSVASDGSEFLVCWETSRWPGSCIYGARLNPAVQRLDSADIPISPVAADQASPSAAFDGSNFVVVWGDHSSPVGLIRGICAARITPSGSVLDPNGIPVAPSDSVLFQDPALCCSESGSTIVFRSSGPGGLRFVRMRPDGSILDTGALNVASEAEAQSCPGVAFDGLDYLVVWNADSSGRGADRIRGERLDASGRSLGPGVFDIAGPQSLSGSPAISFNGNRYLVVFGAWDGSYTGIRARRVNPDGTALDTALSLCAIPGDHESPSVASDGSGWLVVWLDSRGPPGSIYAARVSDSGTVLDPRGFWVGSGVTCGQPAVVFGRNEYLVVWTGDSAGVWGARVSRSGAVLDRPGLLVRRTCGGGTTPSVVFDGSDYFVVCADCYPRHDLRSIRVGLGGQVLDTLGLVLSPSDTACQWTGVTFDGNDLLAAWAYVRPWWSPECDVVGAWVTPAESVLERHLVASGVHSGWPSSFVRGQGRDIMLVYARWVSEFSGKSYNAYRVWGRVLTSQSAGLKPGIASGSLSAGPNPFKTMTGLRAWLNRAGPVTASIYDVAGRRVADYHRANAPAGVWTWNWDGSNDLGQRIPTGVYLVRLTAADGASEVQQLVICR